MTDKIKDPVTEVDDLDYMNAPITLLVLAKERPAIARRLLEASPDPRIVLSTGEGYVVPRWLAEAAGLILGREPAEAVPIGVAGPAFTVYPDELAAAEATGELAGEAEVPTEAPAGKSKTGGKGKGASS